MVGGRGTGGEASIAIVLLQNHKFNKKKHCFFFGTLGKFCIHLSPNFNQSVHLKIFPLHTIFFSSLDFAKKISFLVATLFGFFPLPPTLVGRPFFFDIGWLNSFFKQKHTRVS
jgi:hypothetical protein